MATRSEDPLADLKSVGELPEPLEPRVCRNALDQLDAHLFRQLCDLEPVEALLVARSAWIDALLVRLWEALLGSGSELALVAVGGYGRGELHPGSDIDLLILLDGPEDSASEEMIGALIRFLWDMKLQVGHAVRTVEDCAAQAQLDVTVLTNLMEARFLAGSKSLADRVAVATSSARMWPGRAYFEAKLDEQKARYRKFDDTAYNLEPNIKEGPGGLRDIQTIGWVAVRHYGISSLDSLADVGFATQAELRALKKGREHLWKVRFALHHLSGRAEDRLLFDYQRDLARTFGYQDQGQPNRGVEQFMQAYFRAVIMLERLNERLLQYFSEDILYHDDDAEPQRLDENFQSRKGFLEVRDEAVFRRHPVALLELFAVLQAHPDLKGVRASTLRLMRRDRLLINDRFRNTSEAQEAFLNILEQPSGVAHSLTLMSRYGVLVRYLPAFDKVVGRMQYDLFHVYTVDQHTLFVVRNLTQLGSPETAQAMPLAYEVFGRIARPVLLYLAGFFHDIAKGRGGDHSELGGQEATSFCRLHSFSPGDTELVAWLVQHHLLMSVTAQRRDISDPLVVHEFAAAVGDWVRLDHLYLLTIADISGTSPKLWNAWKASLLAELYEATRYALRRGLTAPIDRQEAITGNQSEAALKLRSAGLAEVTMQGVWETFPAEYFRRNSTGQIAWHTLAISGLRNEDLPLVLARELPRWGTTEIFIYSPDRDGLFATLTSILDYLGLDVVDAKVFTSFDGMSLDSFQVMDQQGRPLGDPYRLARLRARIRDVLSSDKLVPLDVKRTNSGKLRHFWMAPSIVFTEDAINNCTVVEVVCVDRPGLLSDIAGVFFQFDLRVHDARIATFGEKVEDFFRVTDRHNRPLTDSTMMQSLHKTLCHCLEPETNDQHQ